MGKRKRRTALAVASVASVALLAAACGSSGSGGATGGSSGASAKFPNGTIKVGFLTDLSGVQAPVWAGAVQGLQAAFNAVNAAGGVNGQKLEFVTGDAGSTASGELSAAQELVQKDGVVAILNMENNISAVEPTLLAEGVPVIGPGVDGPEWSLPSNSNMFNVIGNIDLRAINPDEGEFAKAQGGTVCGSMGTSDIPSVTESATAFVDSCKLAGLKATPINSNQPYGGTDIGAIALQWKAEGVNAVYMPTAPNVTIALLERYAQLGGKIKVSLLATGYDVATLSNPAADAASQGLGFTSEIQPLEMNTPADQRMKAALKTVGAAGESNGLIFAWMTGWALEAGLAKYGKPNPTRQQFTTAMRSVSNFDADGVMAPEKINFGEYNVKSSCEWVVKVVGKKFVPYPNIPYCGTATSDVPAA